MPVLSYGQEKKVVRVVEERGWGRALFPQRADYVLVEFTPDIPLWEVEQALDTLERLGYVVVMAHIERYACLHAGKTAEKLKESHDVLFQVNANTLLAERGYFRTRRIERWFREGLVDYVASDAHNVRVRPFRMNKAYQVLAEKVGPEEAARMTGMG